MITKKAEYAINILAELAGRAEGQEKYFPSREIAEKHGLPPNLVPQLVSQLQKGGLLRSARGSAGGIRLAVDPEKVSLRQVIELFDGPIGLSRCLIHEGYCEKSDYCPLHRIWEKAQNKMITELEQTSIKDLAEAHASAEAERSRKKEEKEEFITG